ncbi:MAG: helix-turn-helix transcriptional regulator [Bacteroidota bacterium]
MTKDRTSRSTVVRIWTIYTLIKNRLYPDCRKLAARLEVSPRTIERDIEQLRDQMQAPIEYDRLRRGYCFSKDFSMPMPRFSEGEIISLFLGQKLIAQMEGLTYRAEIRSLREKLESMLGTEGKLSGPVLEEFISFDIGPIRGEDWRVAEYLSGLRRAAMEHLKVKMFYQSLSTETGLERVVHPYHLRFHEGAWYLIGFCSFRKEVRIFAVDRIKTMEILDENFEFPSDFKIEDYLGGVWGIMRGQPYLVAIRFDRFQARWIRERPLREGESLEETPDGGVIFRTEVSGLTEIKQWVLSFGSHAEVLEPEELRKEIRQEVERMREIYGQDSTS